MKNSKELDNPKCFNSRASGIKPAQEVLEEGEADSSHKNDPGDKGLGLRFRKLDDKTPNSLEILSKTILSPEKASVMVFNFNLDGQLSTR